MDEFCGRLVILHTLFRENRFSFQVLPDSVFTLRVNAMIIIGEHAPRI